MALNFLIFYILLITLLYEFITYQYPSSCDSGTYTCYVRLNNHHQQMRLSPLYLTITNHDLTFFFRPPTFLLPRVCYNNTMWKIKNKIREEVLATDNKSIWWSWGLQLTWVSWLHFCYHTKGQTRDGFGYGAIAPPEFRKIINILCIFYLILFNFLLNYPISPNWTRYISILWSFAPLN